MSFCCSLKFECTLVRFRRLCRDISLLLLEPLLLKLLEPLLLKLLEPLLLMLLYDSPLLLSSELPDLDEEHLACIEKVEGALGSGWFLVKGAETTRAIRGLERNGVPGLAASGSDSPCTASKR